MTILIQKHCYYNRYYSFCSIHSLEKVVGFRSVFSLCSKMLNSIKKIENKITVVQEILVSLQDELSVMKTKFATEKNIIIITIIKKIIKEIKKEIKKKRGSLTR